MFCVRQELNSVALHLPGRPCATELCPLPYAWEAEAGGLLRAQG